MVQHYVLVFVIQLQGKQEYQPAIYGSDQQKLIITRLYVVMKNYVEDNQKRSNLLRTERLMFEETPQYEMGYILSEVIERYRRAVENTKTVTQFQNFYPFLATRKLQLVEFAYFETYHLVQMMHEIIRKYWFDKEHRHFQPPKVLRPGEVVAGPAGPNVRDIMKQIKEREKKRKKEMKKFYKKNRGENGTVTRSKIYNKFWPIDYGWEVQDLW